MHVETVKNVTWCCTSNHARNTTW